MEYFGLSSQTKKRIKVNLAGIVCCTFVPPIFILPNVNGIGIVWAICFWTIFAFICVGLYCFGLRFIEIYIDENVIQAKHLLLKNRKEIRWKEIVKIVEYLNINPECNETGSYRMIIKTKKIRMYFSDNLSDYPRLRQIVLKRARADTFYYQKKLLAEIWEKK